MFHFFRKKKYLVDYLGKFVDIHNHILPGIDDGAQNLEESMALIRGFGEMGISSFIATPHILPPLYPNSPESIGEAHQQLMDHLMDRQMTHVAIEPAAEHMIDDTFEDRLEQGAIMPLRKKYLLVEMSYLQPSLNFQDAIQKVAKKRLIPILAHPERYLYLHQRPEKYRQYKEQGILFQLNMLSLGGYYGPGVQDAAHFLLEEGYYDFLATDAHNTRHLKALSEIRVTRKEMDLLFEVIHLTLHSFL